ncbi:hypothetical protein, partial [Eubacterium aggregans]|uniref:hypothetical protein n=1 Tax=Eubacterium aggregans TaxID=81409 RepID=UPI003F352885
GDFILPAAVDVTSTDKSDSHAGYKAIDIAAAQGNPHLRTEGWNRDHGSGIRQLRFNRPG